MKAKLFETYGESIYYSDEETFHSLTDWEEISEEELKYVIKWVDYQNHKKSLGKRYLLIKESDIKFKETISQVIKIEKQRELNNKKQAEARKEKLKEKKKKKEEEERKKFEELKKKFG